MRSNGAWLAALAIIGSCSDEPVESGHRTEVSDSAGVPVAFTRLDQGAPTCRIGRETLRIGSIDEQDGTALFGVHDITILGDGRIAVVNRGSSQVKVFSPGGDLLSEFGRRGQGPEEFKNLWSVDVRGEDTLVVGDYRPWRFSFFTPTGGLIRRVELKPPVIERPDFAIPLDPGSGFVMEDPRFQVQDQMVDRVVPLRLYGENGELGDTVGDFWLDRFGYLAKEIGYVGNPIFGAQATFAHLRDDLIVYGTGRYEQWEIWSITGQLRRLVRWQARDRAVPASDVETWRRRRRSEIEARIEITPEMQPVIDAQIGEDLPVNELYPGHDELLISQDGRVWVQEYRRPLDEGPNRWWVFGADGDFVCSALLPNALTVLAIGSDRALGLIRDSLDVEYVVGYAVEYPAGRDP